MRYLSSTAAIVLTAALTAAGTSGCASARAVRAESAEPEWHSPLHRDHPLVGQVWDVRQGQFVPWQQLEQTARDRDFVLLGELHDNPDHHLLQARMVEAVTAGGRRPALAFEMLDLSQQAAADAAGEQAPGDPDALAEAVQWQQSSWPDFSLYRPIFEAGLRAQLPIVAANVPREQVRAAMMEGLGAVDPALRARMEREPPLSPEVLAEWGEEMRKAHCGHLPEGMLDSFVLAQRLRDAQMALRMAATGAGAGAILIAGAGHVRKDRGVPSFLEKDAPGQSILSVAFVEVREGVEHPGELGNLPYDFVVFTPAMARPDPCEAFKRRG
jgi:uncharacterized iron-regulated protein